MKETFLLQSITLQYLAIILSVSKLDTTNLASLHFLSVNYLMHDKLLGPGYKTTQGMQWLNKNEMIKS